MKKLKCCICGKGCENKYGNDLNPLNKERNTRIVLYNGQIHMKWNNGRTLALLVGIDGFYILRD